MILRKITRLFYFFQCLKKIAELTMQLTQQHPKSILTLLYSRHSYKISNPHDVAS